MDIIFAHRGASSDAPENTLPAFELAFEQGCKAIELDVQLSNDGQLIVCHDEKVDRTTDGKGLIREQSLIELKQWDAGSWFSKQYRETRIPTLHEVFSMCNRNILINVEIKNIPFFYKGIEAKLLQEIDHFGFDENVIISSFDHHALAHVQRLKPRLKLGALFSNHLLNPWGYLNTVGLNVYSIHPLVTFVDNEFVQKSHEEGYKVYPFTVDDPEMHEYLTTIGVDGIFSNTPKDFLK